MLLLKKFWQFLHANASTVIFLGTVCFVIIFSVSTLITKPRLWSDEAVSIGIARSFLNHGVLSPQIAPDKFFEPVAFIQSTGYPVTILLSGFFKVFGYGLTQARIFMLGWMILMLVYTFFLAKKLFGKWQACASVLLFASFASFYGSGRTVVGEIPGFTMLLAGLYFLLEKKSYFLAGIFWGLAVVTKPSVFGLVIPAIVLTFLFERSDFSEFFRKTFWLGCGMIPAGLGSLVLLVPNPFSGETWTGLANFYSNPFSSSIADNVTRNFFGVFHSSTLLYFGFFFLLILVARFWRLRYENANKHEGNISNYRILYTFTLVYSVLAFIYYLRSPGWLRYILIAELLILFILPSVVQTFNLWFREKYPALPVRVSTLSYVVTSFLICIQFIQMFTSAQIYSGDSDIQAARYLEKNFPGKSIGILNSLELSVLLDPSRTYLTFFNAGLPVVGDNPLLRLSPPDVIATDPNNRFANEGREVLESHYVSSVVVGGYSIYIRK